MEVGGAGVDESHRAAVHLSARVHDSVDRAIGGQRLRAGGGRVVEIRRPGVDAHELVHRQTVPLVHVVVGVAAQDLGERVGVI
jgi:hypothetical protein